MSARRVFVRLAAFLAAFAAAVSLVVLLAPAPPPQHFADVRPATPSFALADNLETRVGLVALDRETGRSYTALRLRHVGASLPPERLWVRTYFFAPGVGHGRVWAGEPVELVRPFRGGDAAALTVVAGYPWCDAEDAPPDGYFARVQISESPEETPLPQGLRSDDPTTATPVVVHARRAESSRR